MKIIKKLFFQSLALTLALVLADFNVYAADQSICNSGTDVVLHNNGSLKSCQLKDDYDANNIRCKNGGSVSFYKPDGLISFYIDGKLKSCMKQDN